MQRVQWVDPDWKTTWGLGFEVLREKDHTFVGHGGGCPGYYTHIRMEPKTKIAVVVLTNAVGSEVELYTAKAFDLIRPAIEKALKEPGKVPERDPALDRYAGVYDSIWGQSAIVRWEDGLAAVSLAERDLKEALVRLKKTGEHVFRRVREDEEDQLGEEFVFDLAQDGTVTRYKQHSNWYRKVR
jgi:CubicO group peptidase (beta-lactamase class C family)